MSFKNIKSNLSPKARLILLSVGVATVGSAWLILSAFSTDEPEIPSGGQGAVHIDNDNATVKDRGDRPDLLPKDSVQQKEIDELEQKEKEDTKKKGSFMEQLELNNDAKVLNEIENSLGKRDVETGIDDVTDKLSERQEKARRLLEKQERANENNLKGNLNKDDNINRTKDSINSMQTRVSSANLAYIPEPFDEKSFLEAEKGKLEKTNSTVSAYGRKLTSVTFGGMGKGGLESGLSEKLDDSNNNKTKNKTNYSNFMRNPNDFPKADVASLNKFRDMARGDLGPNAPSDIAGGNNSYEESVYPTGAPKFNTEEKILPGEMFYSVLEIEVNTDEISPVRATIVQEGPLKGGVLIGMPKRTGGKSMIEFSSLSLKGQTYSGLSVVAVDPNTMRTAFADNVDYHTFERYFKLAAASIVSGYASALVSVEKQTSATGTESEVSNAIPKMSDRIAVAIGKVGEKLEPKFSEQFDRAPTVTIYKNRDLGIMFLSELIINGENK